MTSDRLRLIEQIFHAARERTGAERQAVLDAACASDSALRREVESLIAHASGGGLDISAAAVISMPTPARLAAGATVGSYIIERHIGTGGMGDVYRARDERLGRSVALKLLPASFTTDADRVARFRREAQLLAALNHPHIAQIHGLEQAADGTHFLVLELVDGETLEAHIGGRPLPIPEALAIAEQIAAALAAAHDRGIIHRDLKPANIALTRDGQVKILDFGLAKAVESSGEPVDGLNSPEIGSPPALTGAGVILGTLPYMAPEQAKGRRADKRADVWAFGCVVYEMLTGVRAFDGADVHEILASVLAAGPDWQRLPAATPPSIHRLLRRCLERDVSKRFRDLGDARLEIADALAADPVPGAAHGRRERSRMAWRTAIGAVAVFAAAAGLMVVANRPMRARNAAPVLRLSMTFAASSPHPVIRQFALSDDGSMLAFVGMNGRLWVRALDDAEARELPGTDGAFDPFFSPDGAWIAYVNAGAWGGGSVARAGKLTKVPVRGGVPVVLADAVALGGSWGRDQTIAFCGRADQGIALFTIPAGGGSPQQVTTPVPGNPAFRVAWPSRVDDSTVLFSETGEGTFENGRTVALSLRTGERRVILEQGFGARYTASGHLVYALNGSLMAIPFHRDRLTTAGPPIRVLTTVVTSPQIGWVGIAVAASGLLVYDEGRDSSASDQTLEWLASDTRAVPIVSERAQFSFPRLSPDGRRLAVGAGRDIWIIDVARGTHTRIAAVDRGDYPAPPITAWTPDGRQLAINRRTTTETSIVLVDPDDAEHSTVLVRRPHFVQVGSWSRTGAFAFFQIPGDSARDVWVLDPGATEPRPFAATRFNERGAVFSPDGRWIVYAADTTGRDDVYVRPYPGPGTPVVVSTGGGAEPTWSRTGREIFYRDGDRMMSASFTASPQVTIGRPQVVFDQPFAASNLGVANYDVGGDGRFVMIRTPDAGSRSLELDAVINWFAELESRAPVQ